MSEHIQLGLPVHLTTLLEDIPVPVIIYNLDGFVVTLNSAAAEFWGIVPSEYIGIYCLLNDPEQVDRVREAYTAITRGESIKREPTRDLRHVGTPQQEEIWYQADIFPIHNAHGNIAYAGYVYQNVTEFVHQRQALRRDEAELVLKQQRIQELSSPVVQLWDGILLAPLIGTIDNQRAGQITEELLTAVSQFGAYVVILDITGVPIVDTAVANYVITAARAIGLLGAQVVLVGIRPEIAQTLVQLQIDLTHLVCQANLQTGIAWAFAQRGVKLQSR